MKKSLFGALSLVGLVALAAVSCDRKSHSSSDQPKEAWNSANDPLNLSADYQRNFSALPKQARLAKEPWGDTYWPNTLGGIAYRWTIDETPFDFQTPSEATVRSMTVQQLRNLSPAEKFDIFRGRFDYPTVKTELQRTKPTDADWTGICHGWAPASYLFGEPKAVVVKGSNGISIPFGSSDVKALLSYYVGEVSSGSVRFLGTRCDVDLARNPSEALRPECRDTNAGSFHLVLANQLGIKNKSFVADVTRDLQVWNQPISGFQTRVISEKTGATAGAAPGTVREVTVETKMQYVAEVEPSWTPVVGTTNQIIRTITYNYRLELNASGEIIGGEWLTDERPDFLWNQDSVQFAGPWAPLQNIYKAAVGEPIPTPVPTTTPPVTPIPTVRPTVRPTVVPGPVVTVVPTVTPFPQEPNSGHGHGHHGNHDNHENQGGNQGGNQTPQDTIEVIDFPEGFEAPKQGNHSRVPVGCPGGFDLKMTQENLPYCAQNGKVLGPQSPKLQNDCVAQFGRNQDYCQGQFWDEDFFLQARGNQRCPQGTAWEGKFGTCTDGDFGYGPFPGKYVIKCQTQNEGCENTNRIEISKLQKIWGGR